MTDIHKIKALPNEVIDQIAAGEVVERPAHLVKELAENSLDAGATQIEISVADGGRYVKVVDNGSGINADELATALDRHATSKIFAAKDLWSLNTFGFRGEALASISAVSKLTLTSKTASAKQSSRITSEFGRRSKVENVGGSDGTTIIVEDLFENVPARLKFMRSSSAEVTAIKAVVKGLALAHPQVEFKFFAENELSLFYAKCAGRKERAEQVFEHSPLYLGEANREGVKAFAVFSDPNKTAKTSKSIWLFAQNRWIQDRGLQAAVMEAYRQLLMHGEYPMAAVWVETPTEQIDVNIHPTKSQVKFLEPSLAFRAVQAAVRGTLERAPWIENLALPPAIPSSQRPANLGFDARREEAPSLQESFVFQNSAQYRTKTTTPLSTEMPKMGIPSEPTIGLEELKIAATAPAVEQAYWGALQVLGQSNLTYILAQSGSALMIVDQHAAHERVIFERLMSAWKNGKVDVQDFLFPLTLDFGAEKVEAILRYQKDLEKLGIFVEEMGPQSLGIRAAPSVVKEGVLANLFEKMAQEILDHGGSFLFEKKIGDLCATMACHSAIRAGQALSHEEMKALLVQMDESKLSSFCPHGRPVFVEYPFAKLERDFGRIV